MWHRLRKLTLIAALGATVSACGSSQSAIKGPPGCGADAYVKLVTDATVDIALTCSAFGSVADCPPEVKEPVINKWKGRFYGWAECSASQPGSARSGK